MKYLVLISIIFNLSLITKTLPPYLKSDYNSELYPQSELEKFIKFRGHKGIVLPNVPKDDFYKPKGDVKPIKLENGLTQIQITNDGYAQNETWVAVNPTNPKNIVATANDFSGISGGKFAMVANVSLDGGKTWKRTVTDNHNEPYIIQVKSGGWATIFDPAITFDYDGTLIYGYGFAQTKNDGDTGDNGIFVSVSKDGGLTWNQWNNENEVYWVTYASEFQGLQDRYTIAVDNYSEKYKGNVYLAWRDFGSYNGIKVGRASKDEYALWNTTQVYNSQAGTQAPAPCVDKEGNVWVTFRRDFGSDKTQAPIFLSTDGGKTYNPHSQALNIWSVGSSSAETQPGVRSNLVDKGAMRISSNPLLASDVSDGPYSGSLYCTMAGKEGTAVGDYKIYLAILRNAGPGSDKWIEKTIDNNTLGNDMIFSSVAVDPVTGYVFVSYYSSQDDPTNKTFNVYLAYSYDGGQTFKHKKLNDTPTSIRTSSQEFGNNYWGDYQNIVAQNNHVYPLYWLQKNANSYSSCELFTNAITTYPAKPEVFNAEYKNNSVELSWSGIYDGLGENIDDYTVKIYKNGTLLSENPKEITSIIDSEVLSGSTIKYGVQVISKDKRGAGEIHEIEIVVGGKLETMPPRIISAIGVEGGVNITFEVPSKSIDGVDITNIDGFNIYNGFDILTTESAKIMAAGTEQTVNLQIPNNTFLVNLKITALRTGNNQNAESAFSNEIIAVSGEPIANLNVDFEGSNVIPFYTNKNWNLTEEKAASGTKSLTDNPNTKYDRNEDSFIYLKPFKVSSSNPNFAFDLIANVDGGDYAYFRFSNDNGQTWKNDYHVSKLLTDQWTGSHETSSFATMALPLVNNGFSDGDVILTQIGLKSENLLTADGVLIDNIRLDNTTSVRNENINNISINPNPVFLNNNINMNFELNQNDLLTIDLFDLNGNLIKNLMEGTFSVGQNQINFSLENMNQGVYFVKISGKFSNLTYPIILQN